MAGKEQDVVVLSLSALLLTAAWVVLVGVILYLFGRTAGGAWSIAGGVVRGVRGWSGGLRREPGVATSSPSPLVEVDDLGDRPIARG